MNDNDELYAEQRRIKAEVRTRRKTFATGPEQGIARQLERAMDEYRKMRAEGVSREDACRGIEAVLRDVFPLTKFPPKCDVCDDTGWEYRTCNHAHRCGRWRCSEAAQNEEHNYVTRCTCPLGEAHRPTSGGGEDAITRTGKVGHKPRSFSRFGA